MKSKFVFSIVALLLFVWACTSTVEKQIVSSNAKEIVPPFQKVLIQGEGFSIDVSKQQSIKTSRGLSFTVPANAFVTDKGEEVKNVNFKVKEYRTPADIIASGIPMTYDSAGTQFQFETAGMFEISADANGNPVFLKDGKKIDVSANSNVSGDFNLYYFVQGKGWVLANSVPTQRNAEIEKKKAELAKLEKKFKKPIEPLKYRPNSDRIIDIDNSYQHLAELKDYQGIMWKLTKESNNTKTDSLLERNWVSTEIVALNCDSALYALKLMNKRDTFEITINPVLPDKGFQKAMAEYNLKQKEYDEFKNLKAELEAQAEFTRNFAVNQMGLCNLDRVVSTPEKVWLSASLKTDCADDKVDFSTAKIYHVTGQNSIISSYNTSSLRTFSYDPDNQNIMVAVFSDNRVGVFSKQEFSKLTFAKSPTIQPYTFTLKLLSKPIEDLNQLNDIIAAL